MPSDVELFIFIHTFSDLCAVSGDQRGTFCRYWTCAISQLKSAAAKEVLIFIINNYLQQTQPI